MRGFALGDVTDWVIEATRQAILDTGATIRELSDEERQAWVDAMKPVWEQFEGDVGSPGEPLSPEREVRFGDLVGRWTRRSLGSGDIAFA